MLWPNGKAVTANVGTFFIANKREAVMDDTDQEAAHSRHLTTRRFGLRRNYV